VRCAADIAVNGQQADSASGAFTPAKGQCCTINNRNNRAIIEAFALVDRGSCWRQSQHKISINNRAALAKSFESRAPRALPAASLLWPASRATCLRERPIEPQNIQLGRDILEIGGGGTAIPDVVNIVPELPGLRMVKS
jgi:hypothetical protein